MRDVDIDRAARIIAAAEMGTLTDLMVVAILLAVRTEGALVERERHVRRLYEVARGYLAKGEREKAELLTAEAELLELAPKTPPGE